MEESVFTCKCGCHEFMGPMKFYSDSFIVVCPNCMKSSKCPKELFKEIRNKSSW